jgi:hypothetical protein
MVCEPSLALPCPSYLKQTLEPNPAWSEVNALARMINDVVQNGTTEMFFCILSNSKNGLQAVETRVTSAV